MDKRRVAFAAMVAVLVGIAVLTQVTIAPSLAQPKVTGTITEKTIKEFTGLNIPGIKSVKYVRATWKPGAKVENATQSEGTDLCEARRGVIFATLGDGTKASFKAGDIFILPLGLKFKVVTVDRKVGYEEFYWRIVPAK